MEDARENDTGPRYLSYLRPVADVIVMAMVLYIVSTWYHVGEDDRHQQQQIVAREVRAVVQHDTLVASNAVDNYKLSVHLNSLGVYSDVCLTEGITLEVACRIFEQLAKVGSVKKVYASGGARCDLPLVGDSLDTESNTVTLGFANMITGQRVKLVLEFVSAAAWKFAVTAAKDGNWHKADLVGARVTYSS